MANTANRLFVTYVDAYSDLLKIWGQTNRTCATYIEKHLRQLTSEFDASPIPSPGAVRKGMFCFAKYDGDNYCRARIISDVIHNSVMVLYIDYGNKDRVDLSDVRIRNAAAESVVTKIVAQAEEFYLANIRSPQAGRWSSELVNEIRRGLCFGEYSYGTVSEVGSERLIQINFYNEDYASVLIRQQLGRPVSLKEQIILLKSLLKTHQSMGLPVNNYKYPNFGETVPQLGNKSNFTMPSKLFLKPVTPEHLNPPMQGSGNFQPRHNKGTFAHKDRRFSAMSPPQNVAYNQSSNPLYSEAKCEPVINSVVIEALANQLKQHLFKDSATGASETVAQGYISQVLDIGTTHNVYVTYVDDGPWSFSVQLVSNEHELNLLMAELSSCKFQPIKLPLVLGYPCIAKSRKFENYCRGVVVHISHSAVKIFFVDFGYTEDLPMNMLYEMPARFFKVKAMSQKFALSGLQQIKPTEEIKNTFTEVVENELLILHVTTLEGENLPTCDLYLKDVNIKKILNEKLRYVSNWIPVDFPQPGNIESAVVTWIDSPQKFYVQLKNRSDDLGKLKAELANLGVTSEYFRPEELTPGRICISFYAGDSKWYRAVITAVDPMKSVTVFYTDYGNTELVDSKMVKKVGTSLITQLSTQAIPCCLHGYENIPSDPTTTRILEELIFEKEVKLKVISNEGSYIVVKIFDNGTDISLKLNSPRLSSKGKSRVSDDEDMREMNIARGDVYDARGDGYDARKDAKLRSIFGIEDTSEDSFRSLSRRNPRNEKSKSDYLSWRLHDDRNESFPKNRDESRNSKPREFKKDSSEMKNEKHDGSRVGRYCFKSRESEAPSMTDRDQKDSDRNWRTKESFGGKIDGRDSKSTPRTGVNLNERLKKAARENEARAHLIDHMVTKYPLKLDNIAFRGETFKKKEVKIGSAEDVIVTYFMNPNEIYVQLVSSKDEFRSVMTEIQNYYATKLNLLNTPKKGDLVVAKFKMDGVLYRAMVTETDPITVRYIDFGNEEISERESLWPMDKKFLELECQCLKCSLPNLKPVEGETWPAPSTEIDKIFEHEKYMCTFLKEVGDGYEVNLIICDNGKDVSDELISSGFASPVTSTPGLQLKKGKGPLAFDLMENEFFSVFISHIVNPTEFYVQIRCSVVESIEEDIQKYVAGEQFGWPLDIKSANIGKLCIIKTESGNWHRAKLTEKRESGAIVRLIDYGNELSIKNEEVRGMPDNFVEYPPQATECSLFIDSEKLTAEVNDKFAECNDKYFAAFVHKVIDETLKVTLYNFITGEKLKFLDRVLEAPSHICPITYLPIIQREMLVTPSYINSAKEIYIQLKDDMSDIEELSEIMTNLYSNLGDSLEVDIQSLTKNEIYAAKSASSDCWYRAQVLCINGESAKILCIDFGNTEEVPVKNLKKLDSSLYDRNAYAKKVSLNIDYDDDSKESINSKFIKLIEGKECVGYFVKVSNVLYAEFIVDNAPITPQLICGSAKELTEGMFQKYIPKKPHIENTKVFISHVSNPGDFWVHEENISSELSMFQEKLQAACLDVITGECIEPGDIIGTVFSDGLWYRALTTDVKDNIISIRFIDYGNNFEVDKTERKFVLLSNELKKPAPFARRCSLKGRWKEGATSRFEDIVMKYEDTFTLITKEENNEVDLLQNGSSITEQLIYEGYQMMESGCIVYITHINSPDDFYIQIGSDQDVFDKILSDLAEASSFEDANDVKLNDLYCAKFPEDNLWYRAKVVERDDDGIKVNFIDYGNCSSVTDIKNLPAHLKTLRPLSMNCCFANEKSNDTWSEAACDAFWSYMNTVPLKIEVLRQEQQTHFIKLFTEDGKDLGEMLAELCENNDTAQDGEDSDNETDSPESERSSHEETAGGTDCSDSNESETDENEGAKTEDDAGQPESMVEAENKAVRTKKNAVQTENADTTNAAKALSEQSPKLSPCSSEKIVPRWVGQGKTILEEKGKSDCLKNVSHSEKIVPAYINRGLSLEQVSTSGKEAGEKNKCTSFSAPGTPSAFRRTEQIYQKVEHEDKLIPGCISNGNLLDPTQDKTAHDDKQVAGNVNGTLKVTQT